MRASGLVGMGGPYTVFSKLKGRFHCDPPNQWPCSIGDGYYHALYGYIDGHIMEYLIAMDGT